MYQAAENRYENMEYKRCGRSGLKLPRIALGLWQNFGLEKTIVEQEEILCHAFDRGITHFDLANNYGHPANGLAEKNFGQALKDCLGTYRDELVISTKAGYDMCWLDFSKVPQNSKLKEQITDHVSLGSLGEGYSAFFMSIFP